MFDLGKTMSRSEKEEKEREKERMSTSEAAKVMGHAGGKARGGEEPGVSHERLSEAASTMGKKGGEETARTHGKEFYSEIGQKGGEARSKERERE